MSRHQREARDPHASVPIKAANLKRIVLAVCLGVMLAGCGGPPDDPRSQNGAFLIIEGTVEDIHTNVFGGYYSGDLGDDRLGPAVVSFQKSVAGTALESDAERLSRKVTEVSTLASQRPPIDKLKTAVQELKDLVSEIKKKL